MCISSHPTCTPHLLIPPTALGGSTPCMLSINQETLGCFEWLTLGSIQSLESWQIYQLSWMPEVGQGDFFTKYPSQELRVWSPEWFHPWERHCKWLLKSSKRLLRKKLGFLLDLWICASPQALQDCWRAYPVMRIKARKGRWWQRRTKPLIWGIITQYHALILCTQGRAEEVFSKSTFMGCQECARAPSCLCGGDTLSWSDMGHRRRFYWQNYAVYWSCGDTTNLIFRGPLQDIWKTT